MREPEKTYFKTTPSQMVNAGHFLVATALACTLMGLGVLLEFPVYISFLGGILGIVYASWRYMVIACTVYEVTSERIKSRTGVFKKTVDELELYRVRDYQVQQPFWLRLVGCGNVVVISADRTTSALMLWAVHDSEKVANTLRKLVENNRRARGVRDLDVGTAEHSY